MTVKSESRLSMMIDRFFVNGYASSVQLRRKVRRRIEQLGLAEMVAMGLLIFCLSFYLSAIRPLQARLDANEQSVIAARQAAKNGTETPSTDQTPSQQLATFYRFFPGEKNSPQWLEKMVAVAEKNGLSLNEGEYKVTQDKSGKLIRYKITLPVQGSYPQIRKFLVSLNTEMPVMALENVQFDRQHIADASVQAEIKLVLYLVQEL